MKNKIVISITFFFVLGITSLFFLPAAAEKAPRMPRILPTVFSYPSQTIQQLKPLSSTNCITEEQLKKWDRFASHLMTSKKTSYQDRVRFFAYLYGAQRDAAFLSYNAHEQLEGSLDPISYSIFHLFFSDFTRPSNYVTDPYSEKLAELVFMKYSEKFKRENALGMQYKIIGDGGYNLPVPQPIADSAKWIPWFVRPATIYLPPAPPKPNDKIWEKQVQDVKNAQKRLTEEQREQVYYWAGLAGPGSGDWRSIVNQYLFQNNVPLAKALLVRSVETMALYDTVISYLNAKYKYSVMRPNVRDPSIEPLIPVPPHPSYPSGHSTEAAITQIVMIYYFPEDTKKWNTLAEQAGMSRIWAGVHYPIDHDGGTILGRMLGEQILNKLREQEIEEKDLPNIKCVPAVAH